MALMFTENRRKVNMLDIIQDLQESLYGWTINKEH